MKKEVVGFFILISIILLFTFVHAGEDQKKVFFTLGETVTLDGKTIQLLGFDNLDANVWVDGQLGTIAYHENQSKKSVIGGLYFSIISISKNTGLALFNITFPFTCGDGSCEEAEDTLSCCTDCGCLSADDVCKSNICVPILTVGDCNSAADCNATTDACNIGMCDTSSYPYTCLYNPIDLCINDDGCCPTDCFAADDTDCVNFDKCRADTDCDDANPCTIDTCEGTPRICSNLVKEGCPKGTTCYDISSVDGNQYCSTASTWLLRKSDQAGCMEEYECLSSLCSGGLCGEPSKNIGKIIIYVASGILLFMIIFLVIMSILHRKKQRQ